MVLAVSAPWVLPIEPAEPIADGAVAIEEGRIAGVGTVEDIRTQFPDAEWEERPDHVLLPGLVNAHTHAAMNLLRGYADDLPLMSWLQDRIWPAEGRWVDPQFVADGTRLAAAEMLRGGVTCFNDMYFFPEQAIESARESGIRIVCGQVIVDGPTAYARNADEYIAKALHVVEQYSDSPGVHLTLAPHAPYTVSDDALVRVGELSEELDLSVHMHVHETADEVSQSVEQYGVRPISRLDRLGLINHRLIAVHAVHLNDDEIALFAERDVAGVHCPTSNLKLASGFARFSAWLAGGLRVGIGTDGVASNNRLDVLADTRLAGLLSKGLTGDAAVVPASVALHTATLGGARALGLGDVIGSLETGKSADLIAVDLSGNDLAPMYDVQSHLINCVGREDISDVWVAGRQVVAGHELLTDDTEELAHLARVWQQRVSGATSARP